MTIIISKEGKNAKQIEPSEFENEDYLQRYVSNNPQCLPLNTNLNSIEREFQTSAGPIDILARDENDVYIIETKLFKNPTRRDVLAQVLDYGIALSHDERFADSTIKYVILMDRLSEETKELINFVNEHCDFSVFAVEMKFYKTETEEIAIPRLYGAEIKKRSEFRRTWDEQSFFEDAQTKLDEQQLKAVQSLYNFSKDISDQINWGTGQKGSFSPIIVKVSTRSIYSVYTHGRLILNFGWLNNQQFEQKYKQLLFENQLFAFPPNFDGYHYSVPIDEWLDHREQFQKIITELLA